jgi:hypothetical protein
MFSQIVGFVFVLVAIHRMFLPADREKERRVLGLPKYSDYAIILFELIIGLLLLSNVSFKKKVLQVFLLFFVVACILTFLRNRRALLSTYHEIWTFQPTAMSFAMHLYIILIVSMLILQQK